MKRNAFLNTTEHVVAFHVIFSWQLLN